LYGILATEEELPKSVPKGVEPISWLLLTNVLTDTFDPVKDSNGIVAGGQ
jgi:hypothetical protein